MTYLKLNIHALFPFLTLLQSLIFATIFVVRGRQEERKADFWLAAYLIAVALSGLPFMLGWLGYYGLWEKYTFLPWDSAGLAAPPLLYFFLKNLTNESTTFDWRTDLKYFWVFLLHFTYHLLIGGYGLLFNHNFVVWWWNNVDNYTNIIFLVGNVLQQAFFFWLSLKLYKNYQVWTKEQFSDTETISFRWLRNTLIISIISIIVAYALTLIIQIYGTDYANMWWAYMSETFMIYYVSISALQQIRVRGGMHFETTETVEEATVTEQTTEQTIENIVARVPKNIISDTEINVWKDKLLVYIDREKPYLQPDLTLSDLATKLKTNTSVLSQVINTGFGKNFNDFINAYRVAEFKAKINTPQYRHLTLLAVAFDCGFNSKTTFNRAFKKVEGQNPSSFQEA